MHKNILIYDISYKSLISAKPLRTGFDKIDGFIRVYGGTRYLALFGFEEYEAIYNKIRNLVSQKSGTTCFFLIIIQKKKFIHMILYL